MKLLSDIAYKVSLKSVSGKMDLPVTDIQFDSRKVSPSSLFVALVGTTSNGHDFIAQVIEKGVKMIVCEVMPEALLPAVTYIQVADSSEALGIMASNFYNNPSAKLKVVGVTGTNGKTTTVTLLFDLFRQLGYSCGMLSTVHNKINDTVLPSTHTTPDAVSIQQLLAEMLAKGCTHCFMEVSSHAAVQRRIAGLTFQGALFSNITHDHLDYHKTFDEYIRAKKLFFDGLGKDAFALVNVDDKRGRIMLQNTKATQYTFSLKTIADYKASIISNTIHGLELDIEGRSVWFKLIGDFNAYNLIAVYGAALLLGEDKDEVLTVLSTLSSAKGRFDQVMSNTENITAIVDYAHTPDALENVLSTIHSIRQGHEKVITIVGCGGNRDAAKRPIMASIACKFSDQVIITSDNPRDEDPMDIIKQMQEGVKITDQRKVLVIADRKEAIKTATMLSAKGDIILIAGKGHENYQEIKGVKYPFDDKEIVKEMYDLLGK
jgi:UDP-N-acetylmuramoyl-L-alanyl-D-glutamate--2,6-diaminopimelate ligase